jgi:tetratricopeptide (TPR) repeat protein
VRSTFSLAYAHESLGEFEEARKLYQQLVEQAPDSAFGQAAQRGLHRCTDPSFAIVYDRFKEWEDPFAVAPGETPSEKPDISFPEIPETGDQPQDDSSNVEPSDSSGESDASDSATPVEDDNRPEDSATSENR